MAFKPTRAQLELRTYLAERMVGAALAFHTPQPDLTLPAGVSQPAGDCPTCGVAYPCPEAAAIVAASSDMSSETYSGDAS